ncbi:MAG: hypothetical protein V2A34_06400 [Lentisphaerota bacterium]
MRIQPLRSYKTPKYPTMAQAALDPDMLSKIPRRWASSSCFATLMGVGLMTKALLSQAEETEEGRADKANIAQTPDRINQAQKPSAAEMAQQVKRATSLVAPVLAEAMEQDGRGTFGCVAINPPTFLSEDEALELIRAELEQAGLHLEESVELNNVEAPVPEQTIFTGQRNSFMDRDRMHVRLGPTNYDFDFGDRSRSVIIEYFSARDYRQWMGQSMSTVSSYDFPELVRIASASFQKYKAGRDTIFGLFFDPLAHTDIPYPADTSGLDAQQIRMVQEERRKAGRRAYAALDEKAKEKLRQQVRYFTAFLKQKGILEGP